MEKFIPQVIKEIYHINPGYKEPGVQNIPKNYKMNFINTIQNKNLARAITYEAMELGHLDQAEATEEQLQRRLAFPHDQRYGHGKVLLAQGQTQPVLEQQGL